MAPGQRIRDKYELVEIAGRGGMAVVWRAVQHGDAGFRRTVAVKQMHEHLIGSKLYVDMFAEEARVLADLESANIANVYDFIAEEGQYYLVMEWIEGIDLGTYVRFYTEAQTKTRWELVTAIGIGLMKAVAASHERVDVDGQPAPVVHRDISPHNILITTRGQVKLIDFGLSLARDRSRELTEPGIVKGKMSYLSPEIVGGKRPTVFSDQFAAGSVLWEALVGRKLFDGSNDYEVFTKLRNAQIQPLQPNRRDVPRDLSAVITRALSPSEGERFASAREMGRQLSLALRSARAPRDLHELLGRSVIEARAGLGLGQRTGEPSTTTPLADWNPEEMAGPAEKPEAAKPASKNGRPPSASRADEAQPEKRGRTPTAPPIQEVKRGVLHRLPFFRKRG
jgi:serine/threonine-protein kinase